MRLEDLRKPFLSMTREEQIFLIETVRRDRLISKAPIKKERKEKKRKMTNIEKIFMEMSDEEKAELLKELEG